MKNNTYPETMDEEIIPLCDSLNALPHIITFESCCGHGKTGIHIWFKVANNYRNEGLFILTRAVDRRYWEYGNDWSLTLSVGDIMRNNILPIKYLLKSNAKGHEAYNQATSLIKNIELHLKHKAFIEEYKLQFKSE